jgi:cystathionine beta-lyase/cystathionine gamma-synthase
METQTIPDAINRSRFNRLAAFVGPRLAFLDLRLHMVHNAISQGGAGSPVCRPATAMHSEMNEKERRAAGITEGLVRISVVIEDARDMFYDFRQALYAI